VTEVANSKKDSPDVRSLSWFSTDRVRTTVSGVLESLAVSQGKESETQQQ